MALWRATNGLFGLAILAGLPVLASADTLTLRRDSVIPVVFEDGLTVSNNHEGDMFTVRVVDTNLLPQGTEMLGRIDKIHPAKGRRPASMDLRFTKLLLPNNARINLDAAPIPLDDKYITRLGDGRIVAKQDIRKQQADVIGGAIGGFIVGSIFHHRVLGTVVGTIAGVAAAENERGKDNDHIVDSGEKVGVLFNRDIVVEWNGANQPAPPDRVIPLRDGDAVTQSRYYRNRDDAAVDRNAPIVITFKRDELQFPPDAKPYRIGDTVMVALEPAASVIGFDVDRRKDRTIYVDNDDVNLRLQLDSRQARLNSDRITLPRTVREHNGVIYVPLEALLPLTKEHFMVNGVRYENRSDN